MKDYIIVGAGLSGICLAHRLGKAGKSFVVFDDDSQRASKVAGGLMNPVVLKRFTLAHKADEQLEKAYGFYADIERHLEKEFLVPLEIYRRFHSVEEQNNWFSATDKPGIAPFLDTKLVPFINKYIPGMYSFGKVLKTSRIDLKYLLNSYTDQLKDKGLFIKETFDYDQLEITSSVLKYKDISSKNVIFCEGFGLLKNPYFSYLPLRGNKGEYIIIRAPELDLEVAVKSSVFIFPMGGDRYAVGASYSNSDKTPGPTSEAREELLKKLKDFITVDFEVVDQVAGIRPSTIDRRPLVGQHPEHKHLFTCNGFGSRGILLAPSISEQLLDHIEKNKPLDPEIDSSRFTRKWYKEA